MKKTVISTATFLAVLFIPVNSFAAAEVSDVGSASAEAGSSIPINSQVKRLERMLQSRNQVQLEMQQQIDGLADEVSDVRGIVEVHSHKIDEILQRQRELYLELDRRLSSPQATGTAGAAAASGAAAGVAVSDSKSENEAYDEAVDLVLKQREYEKAIPAFESFIKTYPDSVYSANAYYWLAQLLFNKGDLTGAESAFTKVVNEYPDAGKRPDAMLKLGMISDKNGDSSGARKLYQDIIKQYPSTSSAQMAQKKLNELN